MATKRAKAAARAAKRIPVAGTAVAITPLIRSAADAQVFTAANITNPEAWKNFLLNLRHNYLGVSPSGTFDATRATETYLPVVVYGLAKKFGLGRMISGPLKRFGLRF